MRSLMAITTPQSVVDHCNSAVAYTTGFHGSTGIDGAELDHFGFCVDAEGYAHQRAKFAADLDQSTEIRLSHNGLATLGLQHLPPYTIGDLIPGLALVLSGQLGLPPGGSYIALKVPSLAQGSKPLLRNGVELEPAPLYGQPCVRVALDTHPRAEGPGVFALYLVTMGIREMVAAPSPSWS